jgi:methionyl aminopeptidase
MDSETLENVRKAGRISREARDYGATLIKEGARLVDVANEVEAYIIRKGARPAFPVNLGLNNVAAHYSPATDDKLVFQKGDLVKLDVGGHVDGFIGDTAVTVEVSTKNWAPLIEASSKALRMAVEMAGDNVSVNAIGGTIERTIQSYGFKPISNLTGHGMKRFNLHTGLTIPNVDDGTQNRIKNDMIIAIEPFATNGGGLIFNDRPGNIYRVLRDRPLRDEKAAELFQRIKQEFNTLPFCERWCTAMDPNAPVLLKTLLRHGVISSYAVLKEVRGGMVSQTEHTIIVVDGKAEVTT